MSLSVWAKLGINLKSEPHHDWAAFELEWVVLHCFFNCWVQSMKCRVCDSHDPVLPLNLCSELWNDEFLIPLLTTVPHLMLLLRGIEKHCRQTILLIYSFSGVLALPELIPSDKHAHAHTPSGWKCTSRGGHVRIYHCENCCFWVFLRVHTTGSICVENACSTQFWPLSKSTGFI